MASPARLPAGIRLIFAYKLVRGVGALLIAFALGTASLWGGGAFLRDVADTLLIRFTEAWTIQLADLLVRASSPRALHIGTTAFGVDGLFTLFEAWALRSQFRWGRWLMVASTASLLPFEVYHVHRSVHAGGVILLLANLAVVAYLLWQRGRGQPTGSLAAGRLDGSTLAGER